LSCGADLRCDEAVNQLRLGVKVGKRVATEVGQEVALERAAVIADGRRLQVACLAGFSPGIGPSADGREPT
jgi:hypothetical protein